MLSILGPAYFQSIILSILKCINIITISPEYGEYGHTTIISSKYPVPGQGGSYMVEQSSQYRARRAARRSGGRYGERTPARGYSICKSSGRPRCYPRMEGGTIRCEQRWRATSPRRQPIRCHDTGSSWRPSPPIEHYFHRSPGPLSRVRRY